MTNIAKLVSKIWHFINIHKHSRVVTSIITLDWLVNIDSAQLTSTTRMSETEKEDRYKRRNLETSKKKKKEEENTNNVKC